MNDLYLYLDKVKKELDESQVIKDYEESKKAVFENKELIALINKYHDTLSDSLKKEIYEYKEFVEYKQKENEVNFLILSINQILKEIIGKRGGCSESHKW